MNITIINNNNHQNDDNNNDNNKNNNNSSSSSSNNININIRININIDNNTKKPSGRLNYKSGREKKPEKIYGYYPGYSGENKAIFRCI